MGNKTFKMATYAGYTYSVVAKEAKDIAIDKDAIVEFEFNGRINFVDKDTDLDLLWRDYSNSWILDWVNIGPNCVEVYPPELQKEYDTKKAANDKRQADWQLEFEAKDKVQREACEAKVKGIEIEIIQEKGDDYKTYVDNNSQDGYSLGVVDYAEYWAKLMQVQIAKGKTVTECAGEMQMELGFLGITGFMYGCAVQALSNYWKHGEELRKWHNKEYGHEGNGIVNPALLTIKA